MAGQDIRNENTDGEKITGDTALDALLDWRLPATAQANDGFNARRDFAEGDFQQQNSEPWQPGDSFRHILDSPDGVPDLVEVEVDKVSECGEVYEEESYREEPRQNVNSPESLLGHCSNLVGYVLTSRPPLVLVLLAVIALWGLPKAVTLPPPSDSPATARLPIAIPPGVPLDFEATLGELPRTIYTSEEIDEFKQYAATEMDEFVAPGPAGENTLSIIYDLPGGEWIEFKAIIKNNLEVKVLYKSSSVKNLPEKKVKVASEVLAEKLKRMADEYSQPAPVVPGRLAPNPFRNQTDANDNYKDFFSN